MWSTVNTDGFGNSVPGRDSLFEPMGVMNPGPEAFAVGGILGDRPMEGDLIDGIWDDDAGDDAMIVPAVQTLHIHDVGGGGDMFLSVGQPLITVGPRHDPLGVLPEESARSKMRRFNRRSDWSRCRVIASTLTDLEDIKDDEESRLAFPLSVERVGGVHVSISTANVNDVSVPPLRKALSSCVCVSTSLCGTRFARPR
jgi:hypothetical protein